MFDNKLFEDWLDAESSRAMAKIVNGESASPNEMMILVLKAQTNHITHLAIDLRSEMIALRQDMDKRFDQFRQDMDKRFEQVDKRFDILTQRIDRFMVWSFSITVIAAGVIITVLK